jgi:hypothetical protein
MYYNTETLKQAKRKNSMVYLTQAQKKAVVAMTNEAGLYLLDFYIAKANVPQYEYNDAKTAAALGWTVKKTADNRRKLQDAELFSQQTFGSGDNKAVITTVAGRFVKGWKPKDVLEYDIDEVTGEITNP